jgi:hypothetical protein
MFPAPRQATGKIGLLRHQRERAHALMLADAALKILFKRFVGFKPHSFWIVRH